MLERGQSKHADGHCLHASTLGQKRVNNGPWFTPQAPKERYLGICVERLVGCGLPFTKRVLTSSYQHHPVMENLYMNGKTITNPGIIELDPDMNSSKA